MNIKSKMLFLLSATLLTLTFTVYCFAAVVPFTDLTNVFAKEKILILQEKGYVKGVGNALFAPNNTLTAAQGIQLIVNAFELNLDAIRFIKAPKATDYFSKANNEAWYANALIIASVKGLELSADLDPNQVWTREEFSHQLIQTMETHRNLPQIKMIPFDIADHNQMSTGYEGSIQRALLYGVVKLDAEGKFNPKSHISRAEAAEQVYNALEYIRSHLVPV